MISSSKNQLQRQQDRANFDEIRVQHDGPVSCQIVESHARLWIYSDPLQWALYKIPTLVRSETVAIEVGRHVLISHFSVGGHEDVGKHWNDGAALVVHDGLHFDIHFTSFLIVEFGPGLEQ